MGYRQTRDDELDYLSFADIDNFRQNLFMMRTEMLNLREENERLKARIKMLEALNERRAA